MYTPGAMAEKLSPTISYAIFLPAFLSLSLSLSLSLALSLSVCLTLTLSKNCFCIDILKVGYIVNVLRAGFNKTSVRAMSADRIQHKTARTMSLHRTCVVEKIAVHGQKL